MALNLDRDTQWLQILRSRFAGRMRKHEYIIEVCPYCGNTKRNFEVNVVKLVFSCWVCRTAGTVRGLFRDFNLPVNLVPDTPHGRVEQLAIEEEPVRLPLEAKDVLDDEVFGWNWAVSYLIRRGLDRTEMLSHGLKFCMTGKYAGRVIWPLYEASELAFFVARRFMAGPRKPYDYPEFRRRNLCHVVLGRQERMTLVLVEGVFQITNIHRLGYSVMPLLGTSLTPEQVRKLARRRFDRYVVFLDSDALPKAIEIAEQLEREGQHARVVESSGPDSDELEDGEVKRLIESAKKPTVGTMIQKRIERMMDL